MGKALGALALFLLAALAAVALADEPPRDTAAFDAKLEKIERLLASAASAIRDGGSRTAPGYESPLRDAVGYFGEIRDLADEARRLDVANDSKMKADFHYESAKAAPDRVAELLEVKHAEVAYRQADFPRQCADAKEALRRFVADTTASKAHDGAEKIRTAAEALARPIREASSIEKSKGALVGVKAAGAARIAGNQGWEAVSAAMSTASASADAWKALDAAAAQACEKVVSWESSDAVREGVDAVGSHARTREQRYLTLTQTLAAIVTFLDDVERDTNESDLLGAQRAGDLIATELEGLRADQGTEPRARAIVEQWPATTDRFRAAMTTLVTMKRYQFHVDRAAEVCRDQESQLVERVRRLVAEEPFAQNRKALTSDANAIAATVQKLIIDKLTLAATQERTMKSEHESVLGFAANVDEWQKVVKSLHAASTAIYDYYRGAMVEARRACAGLELGTNNPPVRRVLDGNCERGDLDTMHEAQQDACDRADRSCERLRQREDCAAIQGRIEAGELCIARRRLIMDKCFAGGDAAHRRELQKAELAKAACLEKQAKLCR